MGVAGRAALEDDVIDGRGVLYGLEVGTLAELGIRLVVVDGWVAVAYESLAKAGVVDDVADYAGVVTKDGT